MLSMLVDIAYKTNGKVDIVDAVKNKSDEYRKEQNVLYEFYKDCIDPHPPEEGNIILRLASFVKLSVIGMVRFMEIVVNVLLLKMLLNSSNKSTVNQQIKDGLGYALRNRWLMR